MRKEFRHTSAIALVLLLVLCLAAPSFAADGTVTYEGGGKFTFGPGTDLSATQLFPDFESVMPGDELSQKVTITNKSAESDYVKVFLRAEPHDESSNPLETSVKDTETIESMKEFLAQLTMTVKNGSETIYDSTADKTDGLTDSVYLGSLKNGESMDLDVTIKVPIEMGNEFAGRSGEIDWVFTVEELNSDASLDIKMEETSKPKDKNGYQEGEEIEYKIVVANDGNVTLIDVVVTDPETGDTFTIEKLEPGQSAEFTAKHVVTAEEAKAGSFENTASAKGTPDNPDLKDIAAGPVKVVSGTYVQPEEPDTGDHSDIILWTALLAAAVIAIIVLLFTRRKKEH
ncbi:MAG: hypothetical protein K6A91_04055 [Clostridia bacterium]|nr:hypothetical protein [Clostridia bacterium]